MISRVDCVKNFIDYAPRRLLNLVNNKVNNKQIKELYNSAFPIKIRSKEYGVAISSYADNLLQNKDLLCNFEEPVFEALVKSDMPTIFIMNHSKQTKDPSMMMLFNALLNTKRMELRESMQLPFAQFVMNKNIINSQTGMLKEILTKFGAVGVDINSKHPNNVAPIRSILNGYVNEKNNIFIFPEGKNCAKKWLPFEMRFQDGTSKLIEKIIKLGKPVKVVPLGFSYGKDKSILGSIYVGKPIYFRQKNKTIISNSANVNSEFAPTSLQSKFKNKPIIELDSLAEISSQLIENMKICMLEAEKRLLQPNNIGL